jgi:hypothetical protein
MMCWASRKMARIISAASRSAAGVLTDIVRAGAAADSRSNRQAVDSVLGAVRRAGMQDLQFLPAVVVGDHRDGQVRIGGELDGQFAELGGRQALGLLPVVPGCCAAEDGLADLDHALVSLHGPGARRRVQRRPTTATSRIPHSRSLLVIGAQPDARPARPSPR